MIFKFKSFIALIILATSLTSSANAAAIAPARIERYIEPADYKRAAVPTTANEKRLGSGPGPVIYTVIADNDAVGHLVGRENQAQAVQDICDGDCCAFCDSQSCDHENMVDKCFFACSACGNF